MKRCNYPHDNLPYTFDICEGIIYLVIGILTGLLFLGIIK